jgi:hypothetical protein
MGTSELFQKFLKKDNNPGRGKKQCPDCEMYVGIRTYQCDCGHKFVEKKTKEELRSEENQPTDEERLYAQCVGAPSGRLVYRGSGSPPVKLTKITPEFVSDYCNLIVHDGIMNGKIYTVSAIKGYLQHQYGYNSGEYMSASVLVDKWYDEIIGRDTPSCPRQSS